MHPFQSTAWTANILAKWEFYRTKKRLAPSDCSATSAQPTRTAEPNTPDVPKTATDVSAKRDTSSTKSARHAEVTSSETELQIVCCAIPIHVNTVGLVRSMMGRFRVIVLKDLEGPIANMICFLVLLMWLVLWESR